MSTNLPQAGPLATFGVAAGPRYGEQIPVPAPVVTVGRGAGADLVIDDDSVSAQHARLEFDLGAWRITDLASTNGTAIEGVKLAPNVPTPLPYGATVRFGGVKLQFREVESADLAAARAAYVPPAKEVTLKEERRGFRFPLWLAVLVILLLALLAYAIVQMNQPAPAPRRIPVPTDAPAARAARP
jgi:pSer/pThr/pTyr-binding forkhead associated (FHA) protein